MRIPLRYPYFLIRTHAGRIESGFRHKIRTMKRILHEPASGLSPSTLRELRRKVRMRIQELHVQQVRVPNHGNRVSNRLRHTRTDRDVRFRRLRTERNGRNEVRAILYDQGQEPRGRDMGHRTSMPDTVNLYSVLPVISGTGYENFRVNRERT